MELDIDKLIDEVQKRPNLYDVTAKEYSDKKLKKILWEEICVELIPNWDKIDHRDKINHVKEIKKRWSSLRDCFRRELAVQQKKIPPSGSGVIKKRRQYIYFEQLLFLLPFTQLTQTSFSSDNEEIIQQYNDYNEEEFKVEQTARSSEDEPSPIPHKKKRTENHQEEEILQVVLKEGDKRNHQFDDDESFLMSLLPAFKKYDDENKYLLRIELMNTILRFDRNNRQDGITGTSHQEQWGSYTAL